MNRNSIPPQHRKEFYLLTLFSIFLLFGCESFSGISHYANRINTNSSPQCVKEALVSINGISNVVYQEFKGGSPITVHGIEKADKIFGYSYKYNGLNAGFSFRVDYKNSIEFSQEHLKINNDIPQDEIDTLRPVMFAIEKAIEEKCGVNLISNIKEKCSSVKCK